MRIPDIKYVIASTTVLLLLTSCGTLNSFSSPGTGQNAKVSTIRKSTRSCPCLYAVYPNQAVTALAPDTSGDWVQIRQIAGSNTGLIRPRDLAEDAGGSLYVVNAHYQGAASITVYAPGASGNVTPIQKIKGPATGLDGPSGIAFDQNTNEVYVSNANNSITIYPASADGNAAPIAVISGPATGLSYPNGITLDTAGNIYVTNTNSITVYAAGSTGNVAPTRTIAGTRTKLAGPRELAVDSSGNIYVGKVRNNPTYILVFGAGSNGNVAPIRKIHGHLTNLRHPEAVALDSSDNVYVGGKGEPINIYAAGSNGNVAPIDTAPISLSHLDPCIRILPL